MKIALLGLFCLQAALALSPSRSLLEEWEVRSEIQSLTSLTWLVQAWKEEHGKNYSTNSTAESQDETLRMKIWIENKAEIEKHNKEFNEVKKREI